MVAQEELLEKLASIHHELTTYFIERHDTTTALLVAIVARQHTLLLGPPGTAKSAIARAVAQHINAKYFEYLLTRFTTPEELFGPLDINALKEGKYVRRTEGKLPEAEIVFLDEIFKASSAILNTLLTAINERIFYNPHPTRIPLITLISASNELPEDDEPLEALYDRILLRVIVQPIQDYTNLRTLLFTDGYRPKTVMTVDELKILQQTADAIDISPIVDDLLMIRRRLTDEGITISDRRFKQSVTAVKAHAVLHGRNYVTSDDLVILQHIFWTDPEQINTVQSIVLEIANPYDAKAVEFLEILDELEQEVKKYSEITSEVLEIYNKVAKISDEVKNLIKEAEKSGKPTTELERVKAKAENLKLYIASEILKIR